jgi:hypothetical protein
MNILKRTFNKLNNYISSWLNFSWLDFSWLDFSWLDFSWLDNAGYVPCMGIPMPPIEIGFVYLELSNDIESFYSSSK